MEPSPADLPSIFADATSRPPGPERDAYLDAACRGDAGLRARAEVLLRAFDRAGGFLDEPADETVDRPPAGGPPPPSAPDEREGAQIGPYRLLQRIGEGGMGAVFMADQERPVRRRVALKVIKAGMDTRQVVIRFEAERQALALMDHPNIARVLDAGTTAAGRPFFVMELVKGIPITQYCDEARLSTAGRLELFIPVCRAIQHAHQKGIIHRDIKPSNVLVTLVDGRPVPKVIDFGIAKAISQRLAERTMFTQFGAVVGTPEYMSPEQADISADDVDTRSDVYSLGILLYELLTGTTPLDRETLRRAAFAEILKRIRAEEPPRPSQRLSTSGEKLAGLSAVRGVEPARLTRLVRGDLDWIVMRALEKERSRRYETATGLAADIRRHLDGDAVEARPPSAGYRIGKFARKHRVGLIVASAFALLLVAATVLSTSLAVVARRALAKSEAARKEAEATDALLIDIFRRPDPGMEGPGLKVAALLGGAIARLDADAKLDPDARARLRGTLAPILETYRRPGAAKALVVDLLKDTARRVEAAAGIAPRPRSKLLYALGLTYRGLGLFGPSHEAMKAALGIQSRHLGEADPDLLATRAEVVSEMIPDPFDPAAAEYGRQTVRLHERAFGDDDGRTIGARVNLADYLSSRQKTDESIPMARETLRRAEPRYGPGDEPLYRARLSLAFAYGSAGRFGEGYPVALRNAEALVRALGRDHVDTMLARGQLAWLAENTNRWAEAVEIREDTLRRRVAILGPDHPETIAMKQSVASTLIDAGRFESALGLLREASRQAGRALGPDHRLTLELRRILADLAISVADSEEAIRELEESLAVLRGRPGDAALVDDLSRTLGTLEYWIGHWDRAEAHFRAAFEGAERRREANPGNPLLARVAAYYERHLGNFYTHTGRPDLARSFLESALRRVPETPDNHQFNLFTRRMLASLDRTTGRAAEAIAALVAILEEYRHLPSGGLDRQYTTMFLGDAYFQVGDFDRAEPLLREGIGFTGMMAAEFARTGLKSRLGAILMARGDYAGAEPMVLDGYQEMKEREAINFASYRPRLAESARRVVELYERWDRPEDAARWRIKLGLPPRELPYRLFARP